MKKDQSTNCNSGKDKAAANIGVISILGASLLFGISAPLVKILLERIGPVHLTGFLYMGSGIGLVIISVIKWLLRKENADDEEARLVGSDYLWLLGAVLCGGILGPILLTLGLMKTPASVASLFLNLECIFTAIVAYVIFKEPVDKRIWFAILAMVASGVILSYEPGAERLSLPPGLLLIVGACLMWAIDNNVTRPLSHKDPFVIARTKGLAAGIAFMIIAWAINEKAPEGLPTLSALVVGAFCYGISLVLFIYSLRYMGAARTGAYFAAAPFIGAIASILALREPVTWRFLASFLCIALGMWLLLREEHGHEHSHETQSHEHRHVHDEHHQHPHPHGVVVAEAHSHPHLHEPLLHAHPHMPDLHHRHDH